MKTLFATLLISLSSFASVAQAGGYFIDGNRLYSDLISDQPANRSHAMGFVLGIHDAIKQMRDCVPENAKSGQIRDIVLATLRDFPDLRHLPARNIIVASLDKAFDCRLFDKPQGSSL